MRFALIIFSLTGFGLTARAECDFEPEALNRYEHEILAAAQAGDAKKLAAPLVCVLQMQTESEGIARYLSSSFLRPILGGSQTPGLAKDKRYELVAKALERLALRAPDVVQSSFLTEFSRGDWRFYTLFCEQGNTEFCSVFLPDANKVTGEPPLLAAASMMRLRKAYQVLKGEQREHVALRLKQLYRDIPASSSLKRRVIEQIYDELFRGETPLSRLG
ncbi:MAG: hypothetical protein AB7G93_12870 [Bdellovibrionales bacterium]